MNLLRRLLYGRYGGDQLGVFSLVLYTALYLLSLFTRWEVLYLLSGVVAALTLFRMLSRNIPKRQRENERFLSILHPFRSRWKTRKMVRGDKDHRYFKCPNCGQQLRVPRGKGTIRVTCRSCGTTFDEKS